MIQTRATNETIRGFAPESISSDTNTKGPAPGCQNMGFLFDTETR